MTIETTGLYRSIHAQTEMVRQLLTDWDGPTRAAEKLGISPKTLLAKLRGAGLEE